MLIRKITVFALCTILLCSCGNEMPQKRQYRGAIVEYGDVRYTISELLPEGTFSGIRYYYQGEGILITDSEIIATANEMIGSFHGVIRYMEEPLYGWTDMELIYPEQDISILLESNCIMIYGTQFWIEEDISPFRDLIGDTAIAQYKDREQ